MLFVLKSFGILMVVDIYHFACRLKMNTVVAYLKLRCWKNILCKQKPVRHRQKNETLTNALRITEEAFLILDYQQVCKILVSRYIAPIILRVDQNVVRYLLHLPLAFAERSFLRSCLDANLLRKHNLLVPEDYTSQTAPIVPAPSCKCLNWLF